MDNLIEICDIFIHLSQGFSKIELTTMRKSFFWTFLLLYVSFEMAQGECILKSTSPETNIECKSIKNVDIQGNLARILEDVSVLRLFS